MSSYITYPTQDVIPELHIFKKATTIGLFDTSSVERKRKRSLDIMNEKQLQKIPKQAKPSFVNS